jgi:hypothetical protein
VSIEIKHSHVSGGIDMKRTIRVHVRRDDWLVDVKVVKNSPIMVFSFCKDHLFGISVAK